MAPEADPLEEIHRAIILFSRASRTRANDMYEGLSFVGYTLLSYVDIMPCPHASDLAQEYGLDRSTVSRQLSELEENGLLLRAPDPHHSRKQRLELTTLGRKSLAAAKSGQRKRLEDRLGHWPREDVVTFGRLFHRFVFDHD
jgi:DNA-binding MarR family transcriptional regulator